MAESYSFDCVPDLLRNLLGGGAQIGADDPTKFLLRVLRNGRSLRFGVGMNNRRFDRR